ncbi:MAG TPA: hypothetical protein VG347_16745 [Verrucomicrobiae bacterium]|nr:hypothetical protein [Verrucomicrobiae bacterium]
MNIQTIAEYIAEFNFRVVESGFLRDVTDFHDSLPNNQGNIIALRDIAEKLYAELKAIETSDLPEALLKLFPTSKIRPFTEKNRAAEVKALIENKTIPQNDFFNSLFDILTKLQTELQKNVVEIERINGFIGIYAQKEKEVLATGNKALISIIFKDLATITSLKELTKTLSAWNRVLPIYHRLLLKESPEDIQLVEVQNGSIDFVVNVDVKVAADLAELFGVGFKCYIAYLSYKKLLKPITDAYFGNTKLIASEEARDKEMLNNIEQAVQSKVEQQHEAAKKLGVPSTHSEIMIKQVVNLVTSHIVRGNDVKLIAFPEDANKAENLKKKAELRNESIAAKMARRELPQEDAKKLLAKYGEIQNEPNKAPK